MREHDFPGSYGPVKRCVRRLESALGVQTRMLRILNHSMEQIAAHSRVQGSSFATGDEHILAHKRSAVERGVDYLLNRCRFIGPNTGT